MDVSHDDNALVEEYFKGQQRKWVIPYTRDDEGKVRSPRLPVGSKVREAMIAASDVDFDKVTVTTIQNKLADELNKMFGVESDKFRINEVSVDQRVRIDNSATGSRYEAKFAILTDNSVFIEPSHSWERIKAPEQPLQRVAAPEENVTLSDESTFDLSTPRGRVEVARQQRRQRSSSR
jgi:hypothetical protein